MHVFTSASQPRPHFIEKRLNARVLHNCPGCHSLFSATSHTSVAQLNDSREKLVLYPMDHRPCQQDKLTPHTTRFACAGSCPRCQTHSSASTFISCFICAVSRRPPLCRGILTDGLCALCRTTWNCCVCHHRHMLISILYQRIGIFLSFQEKVEIHGAASCWC